MSDSKNLLRQLCNIEIPGNIKLSPNRRKVLYSTQLCWGHTAGKRGVSKLWLASTGQPDSSRQIGSGTVKDYAPAWHPDGESIAFISDRAKPSEKWAIYISQTEEGSAAEPVTSVENAKPIEGFAFSPDGQSIAYLSSDEKTADQQRQEEEGEDVQVYGQDWSHTRLRIVDLQSKQTRTLTLDRHITGFCWSSDGDRLAIASARTPHPEESVLTGSQISVVDASLTTIQDLCHFPRELTNLTWTNKLYFIAGVPAGGQFGGHGVYAVDPDSPSPSFESVAFGEEDDATSLTHVNGEVFVKLEHRLEARIALLDGKVLYSKKEELEAFDAALDPDTGEYVLAIATSNVNQPVEVFTTTAGSDAIVQLTSHGLAFKEREFGTCSFLRFMSGNGKIEVDSIYLTPTADANKTSGKAPTTPLPTIVLIHGGPATRLTNAFNTYYYYLTPYLLSLGYGILLPNYRGSSGRGHPFAAHSLAGAGLAEYDDIITATQNAITQGYADPTNLLVGGWSHGGFLSLLCAVRNGTHPHGWKFRAAIPGASISDPDAMALTSDQARTYQPPLHGGRVAWNMSCDDTRNRKASPLWLFHDVMVRSRERGESVVPPMLFLHGANDERCPLSQALGMRRALESEGLPFEFVTYPRQGHIFGEQKFWIDMAMRVGRWCDTYIGEGRRRS